MHKGIKASDPKSTLSLSTTNENIRPDQMEVNVGTSSNLIPSSFQKDIFIDDIFYFH